MHKGLLGRAGVALVSFQLLRRGFECVETPLHSPFGDIWVDAGGTRFQIEVKATLTNRSWSLKRGQSASDFFCFVDLFEAACWVLTRQEVLTIAPRCDAGADVSITAKQLPKDALQAWSKITGRPDNLRQFVNASGRERPKRMYTSTRVVRRQMADGTLKEYVYPGRGSEA